MSEEEVPVCGRLALPKFRRQAGGTLLTPCCAVPHHKGNHIYCLRVDAGINHNSHTLEYFEEIKRTELKPVLHADMKGRVLESEEECAALWQYFQLMKES